jgi:small subunit ribosomal protein S17
MPKSFTGVVTSAKPDKTIVVSVASRKTHPIYKKQYRVTTSYMAHDETNKALLGDTVIIRECKPISRHKRFELEKVLSHAAITHEEKSSTEAVEAES